MDGWFQFYIWRVGGNNVLYNNSKILQYQRKTKKVLTLD